MGLATKLTGTASRLLEAYGEQITFTRTSEGTFDPVTGTTTGGSDSSWTVSGQPMSYELQLINGNSIQSGDVLLMIESSNYIPRPNDKALYADESWKVVAVPEVVRAQGTTIVYTVQVRR